MSNRADIFNGGAGARSAFASYQAATAGGSGDATEADGAWVSRDLGDLGIARSAKLIIAYRAVLAQGATMTIAANIQDATSSGGANADDYGKAYSAATVATGGTGGSTEVGTVEFDFDLSSASEFIRSQITPNLSAANTDTAVLVATWVFFGTHRTPASNSVI